MRPRCVTGNLDEACDKSFVGEGRPEPWMDDYEEGLGGAGIVVVGGTRGTFWTRMGACGSASWQLHNDQAYILLEDGSGHPTELLEKGVDGCLICRQRVERCRELNQGMRCADRGWYHLARDRIVS
jgi:hypothetical protein